jgi:hypothetical protein
MLTFPVATDPPSNPRYIRRATVATPVDVAVPIATTGIVKIPTGAVTVMEPLLVTCPLIERYLATRRLAELVPVVAIPAAIIWVLPTDARLADVVAATPTVPPIGFGTVNAATGVIPTDTVDARPEGTPVNVPAPVVALVMLPFSSFATVKAALIVTATEAEEVRPEGTPVRVPVPVATIPILPFSGFITVRVELVAITTDVVALSPAVPPASVPEVVTAAVTAP